MSGCEPIGTYAIRRPGRRLTVIPAHSRGGGGQWFLAQTLAAGGREALAAKGSGRDSGTAGIHAVSIVSAIAPRDDPEPSGRRLIGPPTLPQAGGGASRRFRERAYAVRRPKGVKRSFGLILLAAAMTTGCATSAMTAAVVAKTGTGVSARPAAPSAPAPSPAAGQRARQQAEAAAAALLAEFVPPPGARRLGGPPDLPDGWEQHPQSILVSNSMVDQAAFWEAPGDPQSLLSWEQARLTGKRFTLGDADFGPPSWDRVFDLPAGGVLTNRELTVEVAGAGNGHTAIRLDAEVAWQPSRPPDDHVPDAARVVTISELASGNPQAKRPPAPATITDPTVTGRLAALVDSLPVSPLSNEAVSCPAAFGGSLQLAFRTSTSGPVVALVQTDQACGMVDFTVIGQPVLGLENNANVNRQILAIASLPWKLP